MKTVHTGMEPYHSDDLSHCIFNGPHAKVLDRCHPLIQKAATKYCDRERIPRPRNENKKSSNNVQKSNENSNVFWICKEGPKNAKRVRKKVGTSKKRARHDAPVPDFEKCPSYGPETKLGEGYERKTELGDCFDAKLLLAKANRDKWFRRGLLAGQCQETLPGEASGKAGLNRYGDLANKLVQIGVEGLSPNQKQKRLLVYRMACAEEYNIRDACDEALRKSRLVRKKCREAVKKVTSNKSSQASSSTSDPRISILDQQSLEKNEIEVDDKLWRDEFVKRSENILSEWKALKIDRSSEEFVALLMVQEQTTTAERVSQLEKKTLYFPGFDTSYSKRKLGSAESRLQKKRHKSLKAESQKSQPRGLRFSASRSEAE